MLKVPTRTGPVWVGWVTVYPAVFCVGPPGALPPAGEPEDAHAANHRANATDGRVDRTGLLECTRLRNTPDPWDIANDLD